MARSLAARVALASCLVACSSTDAPSGAPPAPAPPGAPAPAPAPTAPAPAACPRALGPADRARKVVISHPFGPGGAKDKRFEVLELSPSGDLTKTGKTFEMGRALGSIAMTPDGVIGIAPQEDGSLGVFAFDAAGDVRVLQPAFKGPFYAHDVVVSADGQRGWVIDAQTADNGGGVHEIAIGCDGTVSSRGLVVPGGKAHAMALLPGDPSRAVLISGAAFDAPADAYAHRLALGGAKPTREASGAVFPDRDAIATHVAVTPDGKYAVVSDNGFGAGSRLGVVALDSMRPVSVIATPNPVGVAMSPFGGAALLLNSDGEDALRVVKVDPANAAQPITIGAEVTYKGKKTELPLVARVVERGVLAGRVLVSENTSVRQLEFTRAGAVVDHGAIAFEGGVPSIVGGMGMQP